MGIGGTPIIECHATASGRLRSCRPVLDGPAGYGLVDAALRMAQVGYMTVDPRPSAQDEVVRVKVKFELHGP
jgi:hypothetical protein